MWKPRPSQDSERSDIDEKQNFHDYIEGACSREQHQRCRRYNVFDYTWTLYSSASLSSALVRGVQTTATNQSERTSGWSPKRSPGLSEEWTETTRRDPRTSSNHEKKNQRRTYQPMETTVDKFYRRERTIQSYPWRLSAAEELHAPPSQRLIHFLIGDDPYPEHLIRFNIKDDNEWKCSESGHSGTHCPTLTYYRRRSKSRTSDPPW